MNPWTPESGESVLRDHASGRWLRFARPIDILQSQTSAQVMGIIEKMRNALSQGLYAAGYVAYEAASGFDEALKTHASGPLPAAWFGLYEERVELEKLPRPTGKGEGLTGWAPTVTGPAHTDAVNRVRALIARGDTYQVNLSHRLQASFSGSAWELFLMLTQSSPPPFSAYLDTGRFALCSLSPELFFALDGDRLVSRPMKGTTPRGLRREDDQEQSRRLHESSKDRAENVMIVDMVRNDMGRVARPGSVEVTRLFDLEKYPGQWQMTSTVEAETTASLEEIFRALFPAASITGAPKARTMEIITELEAGPRGAYTGAIGYAEPGRRACFSVAIRTAVVDREEGMAEYGVGGGIVWDSTAQGEWEECLTKSVAVTRPEPTFHLLETLRWEPGGGFVLLRRHLDRMVESARYFDYPVDQAAIECALRSAAADWSLASRRIRILSGPDGAFRIEAALLDEPATRSPARVALCPKPIDATDRFLYHKTTHREVFERALAAYPDRDDILLRNERGELTESCRSNVVVELDGCRVTPPVECGLLAGTYRAEMLADGRVREQVIRCEDLSRCNRILLVNSVRGEREAILAP